MTGIGVRTQRASLQETVQERVKQFIIENDHRSGDPLPPEAELARRLGISRPSLREAMRVLQTIGVVESRHGSGTYVGRFRMETLVDGISFSIQASSEANALHALSEILEVRELLEGHLVRQCASSITPEQVEQLEDVINRMQAKADAGEIFTQEDMEFHEVLYSSIDNAFMVQLVTAFWKVFNKVEVHLRGVEDELDSIVTSHRNLLDALKDGDQDQAAEAMNRHFDGIRERVKLAR